MTAGLFERHGRRKQPACAWITRGSFPDALWSRLSGKAGSGAIVFEEFQTTGGSRKTVKREKTRGFEDAGH